MLASLSAPRRPMMGPDDGARDDDRPRGRSPNISPPMAGGVAQSRPVVKTILPIWLLLSIRRCASAASAKGKVLKITGATLPASISGQTFSCSDLAMAPFSATERGPEGGAGEGLAAHHQRAEIDLGLAALEEGDLHQPALDGEDLQIAVDIAAAHHVEDDIDAFARRRFLDHRDEILAPVIDRAARRPASRRPRISRGCPPW